MSLQKLRKPALYVLQALLAVSATWIGCAIIGGLFYLNDASRVDYADMRPEIFSILKNESILVFVGTLLLFWIGTVRTRIARSRAAEQK